MVNFPKWGDEVPATVVELKGGHPVPFPSEEINQPRGDDDPERLVSVQSIVVDPADRLWILDTGSPMMQPVKRGGPKLVCVNLQTDTVAKTIVVDLESGEAWRRLHDHPSTKAVTPPELTPVVEGRVFAERPADGPAKPVTMGSDGIAISADGEGLWYCPRLSRRWYSVPTEALRDRDLPDSRVGELVRDEGDKGGAADGLETDDQGRFYSTNWSHNAVLRRLPDGTMETLVHDPRLLWPDTMSVATDGYLYVTANQLHRQAKYQRGEDQREYPYSLFRVRIDAGPVLLR